jgi:hypothetical protein
VVKNLYFGLARCEAELFTLRRQQGPQSVPCCCNKPRDRIGVRISYPSLAFKSCGWSVCIIPEPYFRRIPCGGTRGHLPAALYCHRIKAQSPDSPTSSVRSGYH